MQNIFKKQNIILYIIIACMILFTLVPFSKSPLKIRVYTADTVSRGEYRIYFATLDGQGFSNETIVNPVLHEGYAEFQLPESTSNRLGGLRLDFSTTDEVQQLQKLEVYSGGFLQETFQGEKLLREQNLDAMNHISHIDLVRDGGYVVINGSDPYVVFNQTIVGKCNDCCSTNMGMKLCLCCIVLAAICIYKKRLFHWEEQLPQGE